MTEGAMHLHMVLDFRSDKYHWVADGYVEIPMGGGMALVRGVPTDAPQTLCAVTIPDNDDESEWQEFDWPIRATDFCEDCWNKAFAVMAYQRMKDQDAAVSA